MKKTTLATVDGFTPLIDALVQQFGIVTAAVFGKVWRYCQMSDGVCKASQERLARELGMNRVTINQHIDILVKAGYLKDKTPNLSGKPHEYADTGKANLSISITGNTKPVKQIDTTCKSNLHPPVNLIDTKKEVKIQKETSAEGEVFKLYEQNIGNMTPIIADRLGEMLNEYGNIFVADAITEAAERNARNIKYIEACCRNWKANGRAAKKPAGKKTTSSKPIRRLE
jgi:DnaD/phage-associated family protein